MLAGEHRVKELHVAVGILESDNQILLTRRRADVHQGGRWEFPGGKFESGEDAEASLARELEEELGVRVLGSEPLIEIPFRYPDAAVRLHVRRVTAYTGTPQGREGQPLRWCSRQELKSVVLPAANRGIVSALLLPRDCLITPEPTGMSRTDFLDHLAGRLDAGVRWVQLRAKSLDEEHLYVLAREVLRLCEAADARLLLNASPALALRTGAHGVHLSATRAGALVGAGSSLPSGLLSGASCHDTVELRRAEALGVDYVFCSPVLPTDSHPGAPALGWAAFADLCATASVPVYALGGVGPEDLPRIRACGGHGSAGIRGYWNSNGAGVA